MVIYKNNSHDLPETQAVSPLSEKQIKKNPIRAINLNWAAIKQLTDPTEEEQIAAVRQNYKAIAWIDNPTINAQLAAIEMNSMAIQYIRNPSIDVQLAAINSNPYSIMWLRSASEELKLLAVKLKGGAIRFIHNPSIEIQIEAVRNTGKVLDNVDPWKIVPHLTEKELQKAITEHSGWLDFIEDIAYKTYLKITLGL